MGGTERFRGPIMVLLHQTYATVAGTYSGIVARGQYVDDSCVANLVASLRSHSGHSAVDLLPAVISARRKLM